MKLEKRLIGKKEYDKLEHKCFYADMEVMGKGNMRYMLEKDKDKYKVILTYDIRRYKRK